MEYIPTENIIPVSETFDLLFKTVLEDSPTVEPTYSSVDWVTTATIGAFTTDQYLARLELSDSDLLSSLPYKEVVACPTCMNRSVVERKTQTELGKHYCPQCRLRVWGTRMPYYFESLTANPQVALTRHRHYLTTRCSEKLAALKRLERLGVSPFLRGKAYFFSLDTIDADAYASLERKYETFYADHAGIEPTTKIQIQLCSNGGNVFQAKRFVALINANQGITHLQGSVLYSAAFTLYFNAICSKDLDADAVGMYHLSRTCNYVLGNGLVIDHVVDHSAQATSLLFLDQVSLNEEEKSRIKMGEDVYFTPNRLHELYSVSDTPLSKTTDFAHKPQSFFKRCFGGHQ
ncbi:MAG: hypothetical protein H7Z72_09175 [Bacteroidetes bacterium]|nr:hypothetical protein [Fibrella sp.]